MNHAIILDAAFALSRPTGGPIQRWSLSDIAWHTTDLATLLLFFVALAVAVWVLAQVTLRSENAKAYSHPGRLFDDLCRAHHLDRRSRRLLARVAEHLELSQPAVLFALRESWEPALEAAAFERDRARLAQVHAALFDSPLTAAGGE